jgi:hypothetical protein
MKKKKVSANDRYFHLLRDAALNLKMQEIHICDGQTMKGCFYTVL